MPYDMQTDIINPAIKAAKQQGYDEGYQAALSALPRMTEEELEVLLTQARYPLYDPSNPEHDHQASRDARARARRGAELLIAKLPHIVKETV